MRQKEWENISIERFNIFIGTLNFIGGNRLSQSCEKVVFVLLLNLLIMDDISSLEFSGKAREGMKKSLDIVKNILIILKGKKIKSVIFKPYGEVKVDILVITEEEGPFYISLKTETKKSPILATFSSPESFRNVFVTKDTPTELVQPLENISERICKIHGIAIRGKGTTAIRDWYSKYILFS